MSGINNPLAWIERAEEDLVVARSILRRKQPLINSACYHAHQCAEKYLKAVLITKDAVFPKTHDLLMLSTLCDEVGIIVPIDPKILNALNDYSINIRYPGETPSLQDARDAVKIAQSVRKFVRKLLGIQG
jgi:HEPN domain-containing protein